VQTDYKTSEGLCRSADTVQPHYIHKRHSRRQICNSRASSCEVRVVDGRGEREKLNMGSRKVKPRCRVDPVGECSRD
jgi:hypothetical protein